MSDVSEDDILIAKAHIKIYEKSLGSESDDTERRDLLGDKTNWSQDRIWAVVDAIDEYDLQKAWDRECAR